jgi:hypothetical protein
MEAAQTGGDRLGGSEQKPGPYLFRLDFENVFHCWKTQPFLTNLIGWSSVLLCSSILSMQNVFSSFLNSMFQEDSGLSCL